MSPTPDRQAVLVGLFVTAGLAVLVGGILMIGSIHDTFTRKVTATAVFDEVGGLSRGDNIWYAGVKVGIVTRLRFTGDAEVEVQLKIDAEATPYIHGDALARVGSDGLIGNRVVILYGGSPQAPAIQEGDVLVAGETVSTEQILTTFQENNVNLLAITTDLKGISAELAAGRGSVGRLLKDEALAMELTESVAALHAASDHAQALTGSLSGFAADLNRPGGLPKDLATDRDSYASLVATLARLQDASADTARLMDGLAQGAEDPATPIGVLVHDTDSGAALAATMGNLDRSSALLAEDLEALQHNFLFRRYFRKKARAEARAVEAAGSP